MPRLLHTKSDIFFKDPHVIRVEYPAGTFPNTADDLYRKLTRATYKNIKGTWGHSELRSEEVRLTEEEKQAPVATPLAPYFGNGFNGMGAANLAALFGNNSIEFRYRGYIVFSDAIDVLQFRLTVDSNAREVFMWPELKFMIHEYIEDES
jgi:hypothetical protein